MLKRQSTEYKHAYIEANRLFEGDYINSLRIAGLKNVEKKQNNVLDSNKEVLRELTSQVVIWNIISIAPRSCGNGNWLFTSSSNDRPADQTSARIV